MTDLATPPILLFRDERTRLVDARTRAVACIAAWPAVEPLVVKELVRRLPIVVQLDDAAVSLLEAAPWPDYFDTHESAFSKPGSCDRVFANVPDLLDRVDDDGLLALTGLDARPHGLIHPDLSIHYHQFLRRGIESIHGDREGGRSILNAYVATSFRWTADDRLRTIEIEELVPVDDAGPDLVLVRYLHAIHDTSKKVFVHCDGAVEGYQRDRYPRALSEFGARE